MLILYDDPWFSPSGSVKKKTIIDEKGKTIEVHESYYRKIRNGIDAGDGWKIRINMNPRNETLIAEQEFVLIITIKDPNGNDIYSEVINGLRERGYVTNNLEIKQKVRIQNTK